MKLKSYLLLVALATLVQCRALDDDWDNDGDVIIVTPTPTPVVSDYSKYNCNECVLIPPEEEECDCLEFNQCTLKDLSPEYQGDLIGCALAPQPTPTTPPVNTTCGGNSTNPRCSALAFNDGKGGDLVKLGEHTGLPAHLLDQSWQGAATVEWELVTGGFEKFRFAGCANPSQGKERQHFRGARQCTAYTGQVRVCDADKCCEFNLPKSPCERID